MNINYQKIGWRISQRRRELKMKQSDFAEKLNVTPNYVSNIETGISHASFEIFLKICEELYVTPDYFILGTI